MKQDRRGSWYLLTGAVLGIAFGLFYSWLVSPVKYVDAPPYALREDYKEDYRALVAAAYMYNGDLVRAQDRLAQLKDEENSQSMAIQAQRALAEGRPAEEVRALGILAKALGQGVTPFVGDGTPTPVLTAQQPPSVVTLTPLFIEATPTAGKSLQYSPAPTDTLVPMFSSSLQSTSTPIPTPTYSTGLTTQP